MSTNPAQEELAARPDDLSKRPAQAGGRGAGRLLGLETSATRVPLISGSGILSPAELSTGCSRTRGEVRHGEDCGVHLGGGRGPDARGVWGPGRNRRGPEASASGSERITGRAASEGRRGVVVDDMQGRGTGRLVRRRPRATSKDASKKSACTGWGLLPTAGLAGRLQEERRRLVALDSERRRRAGSHRRRQRLVLVVVTERRCVDRERSAALRGVRRRGARVRMGTTSRALLSRARCCCS